MSQWTDEDWRRYARKHRIQAETGTGHALEVEIQHIEKAVRWFGMVPKDRRS